MATYEYPTDDFKPETHCMQWAITDGACCPSGTHQRECEIIQGYNKTREQNRDDTRHFPLREALVTGVFIFFAVFFGLSQLNKPAPLCAPTVNCEVK